MNMKEVMFILFASLVLLSCENEEGIKTITLDLNSFTIDIPAAWVYEQNQGYDSYVGDIKISGNEKINFDFGWYSNPLDVDNLTHAITNQTIDGKNAIVVRPKDFMRGTTGVYIDSLETTMTWKFTLSGVDLSKSNQILLLKSIESLKFRDFD